MIELEDGTRSVPTTFKTIFEMVVFMHTPQLINGVVHDNRCQ